MKFNIDEKDKNRAGVYIIRNSVDKRVYVGSSVNLHNRYKQHFNDLKKGEHHADGLQALVKRHGAEKLTFSALTFCKPVFTFFYEQKYINKYRPFGQKGFNTIQNVYIPRSPRTFLGKVIRLAILAGLIYLGYLYRETLLDWGQDAWKWAMKKID